ncbi:MAG: anti-sigma factor family protein [Planctomycetota bacterium]
MLCSEFDARMHKLLDERAAPERDGLLLSHAHHCPQCAARLETMTCLLDSLELYEPPELPAEFAQRVVEAVDSRPTTRRSSTRGSYRPLLPLMGMAASLLLLAVPLAWYAVKPEQVAVRSPSSPPPPAHSATPETRETLPSPTKLATTGGEDWLVSGTWLERYWEAAGEQHREQMNSIADELRPIATPFNAALTAIRRSIPVDSSEVKGEPHAAADPAASPHLS